MRKEAPEKTLEDFLHSEIPLTRAMGILVESCSSENLILTAPLEPNHNHLGTAFGGSLATMATLAGYCALWTALGDRKIHIVVRRSSIEYLRPVTGAIRATCGIPNKEQLKHLRKTLSTRGKARLALDVVISENDSECVRFTGEFVALL
ncbi:MAG: thioesterase domain-containing protein [Akkermansiaceae bacterium]|nr:thioesterase domain-containing protein [Akkermansiaceae bacterium]